MQMTMNTAAPIPENAYVKIHDEAIDISFHGKKYLIGIDNIRKMYLKKKKNIFFPAFMGIMVSHYDKNYRLYIRTEDEQEIKIGLKAYERQYFLGLISFIRNLKAKNEPGIAS